MVDNLRENSEQAEANLCSAVLEHVQFVHPDCRSAADNFPSAAIGTNDYLIRFGLT